MNNFSFTSKTEFVFGKDTELQTGNLAQKYGAQSVMIIYGGGSVVRSGLLERVQSTLSAQGINYILLGGVQPNPTDEKVYEGIEVGRLNHIDFVLAVGGGSVIDSAKAIAVGIPYNGDFWNFFCGKASPKQALPVGVVLTIPASGSEASGNAVITRQKSHDKISLRTGELLRPVFSIMNPALTLTLSPWQTSCGIMDIMSHTFERYFTNTTGVEVTDRLCEGLLKAVIAESQVLMNDPNDLDARSNIMWAGTMAHNGICGVGREEDWSCHDLEHEISALYNVTHGAGLAVIIPAWMTWMTGHHPEKVVQFAERVWDVPQRKNSKLMALEGVQALKEFIKKLHLPATFSDLGIENPDIDFMVDKLQEHKGPTSGHYVPLDRRAAHEIYELAL